MLTASGTTLALKPGAPAVTAGLVGVITGMGSGVLRDVLLDEIPTVLRRDVYAITAVGGAAVVVAGDRLRPSPVPVALVAALLVAGMRVVAGAPSPERGGDVVGRPSGATATP
jgi:uncharacterized membrane protein YeiH